MKGAFTLDEAAAELLIDESWLKSWLSKNPADAYGVPFYVPMGRTKTFDPSDIIRIRAAIKTGEGLPDRRKESVVYFVSVRGFIKIGWTTNWRRRFTELQIANPEPIEVLLIVGRPPVYEKTMHAKFAGFRAAGEWFRDVPDIRQHIEGLVGECWYRAGRLR
jgi:hypothetical protein